PACSALRSWRRVTLGALRATCPTVMAGPSSGLTSVVQGPEDFGQGSFERGLVDGRFRGADLRRELLDGAGAVVDLAEHDPGPDGLVGHGEHGNLAGPDGVGDLFCG